MDDGRRTATEAAIDVDIDRASPWEADMTKLEEKHRRYEAAYSRRLRAKYFSKKAIDGDDIFDTEEIIQNESIKVGRWPCIKSFMDPVRYIEDRKQSVAAEAASVSRKEQSLSPRKS